MKKSDKLDVLEIRLPFGGFLGYGGRLKIKTVLHRQQRKPQPTKER
ncbi:hypothetical protein HMPREF1051_0610 [Neisseria sicca VK64]|uniref:Uncharacterized protein n=1 Tax=Neisseria sicca VK64 TaxID=1095748 RepID=I2NQ59_NEISI|nr:hypothetical protein HMPREF1051_0610 [Neisseria sicca VK64]